MNSVALENTVMLERGSSSPASRVAVGAVSLEVGVSVVWVMGVWDLAMAALTAALLAATASA